MVSAMNLHPLTPEQKNEYTRIAYYYYEAGRTQDQIAQRLGISRQRVNRILAECIERGIVRITVDRSPEDYFASESALEEKYRLKAVRLAHSLGADQLYGDLGVVAGQYLKSIVKRGDIIGCVPGRGVAGLVDNMPQMERTGLTVTQLMGSESRREYNLEVDSILHRFARKLSALPQPLYAPVLVSNAELRESIVREPYYQEAYAVMKRCTVAVVGIGTATTYEQYITGPNRQPGTAAAGAAAPVGEICTHCFDADGQPVEFPFSNRILAISREDYKNIPTRIGIAGGPEKLAAIRAALRGGYVNVLITDLDTAAALLDET